MKKLIGLIACVMLLGLSSTFAQSKTVTGTVIDQAGQGIPGVSVAVKGTNMGEYTDIDGKWTLKVTPKDVLIISFVGMKTQEIRVGKKTVINVTLVEDRVAVDEVVVTAMGIKRSEKALGYAATTVKSDELTAVKKSDVMSSLTGKVAGVQISASSSDPGASNSVIIRGVSSLNGNNQPLYVIDGVPMNNSTVSSGDQLNNGFDYGSGSNMVNPDDVAAVTVLKGAAATALYGSRAANGVILITTKSGKKGERGLGITVSSSVQVSDLLRLPDFQNEFGMGWDGHHTTIENGSWGPRLDGSLRLWGNIYDVDNSQKLKPFVAQEDNIKDFFEYGIKYQNSVSFSGATDNTSYYASYSNVNDDGLVPGAYDTYNKNTFSVKGDHKFNRVKLSTAINFGEQKNKYASTGQGLTMINSLYQTPRDISIIGLEDYKTDPFDQLDYYFTPYSVINPYMALADSQNEFRQQKIYGKVQAEYNVNEKIDLTYRLGYDATDNEAKRARKEYRTTPGTPNAGSVDEKGYVHKEMSRLREMNHDLFGTYNDEFDMFKLNVVAGFNANERTYSFVGTTVTGLDIPDYFDLSNSPSTPVVDEYSSKRRLIGAFGSAEISYNELLYLTLTARNDWSSTLPEDNNSFFYPGTTLSFVFSNLFEGTLKDLFTFGKARVAYGKTGNDAGVYMVDPYYLKSVVTNAFGDISFPLGGKNAYEYGNTLGNPTLSPEITTEFEFGLNFALFNGRIVFDGSYYNKKSDKQIFALGMDPASGFSSQNINLGEIQNKGYELMLSVTPVETSDFRWDMSVNYTHNEGEVLSLPEEMGGEITLYRFGTSSATTSLVARVGGPIGEFKVTMPKLDPNGNIIVNEETGRPIADAELQYVGDVNSDFEMGISNKFTYKGLSLGFDIDIRQGGLMYSRTKSISYFTGNALQTLFNDRNPYIIPNSVVETINSEGETVYVENTNPISIADLGEFADDGMARLSREFLIDRSYVKLRNVTIGYNLPKKWISKLSLQNVKFSLYGNNLLLWTPKDNSFIDPEVTSFGNDLTSRFGEYSANPTTRKVGFSLQVTF